MTVERTELREAFFAEVIRDPWLALFNKLIAEYWAFGYEQALRDLYTAESATVGDLLFEESFSDRIHRAQEWLTEKQRKSEIDAQVAMVAIARATNRKLDSPFDKR